MKSEIKKKYDITKQDVGIGPKVNEGLWNEFRAFCVANGLKQYEEINKAIFMYLVHVNDLTGRGLKDWKKQNPRKWEAP
jgi:hypothetical protein